MAKSKKKKQGRRRRKKNPGGWLTAKDPMLGLPNWVVAGSIVAVGFIWFLSGDKQVDKDLQKVINMP